MNSNVHLDEYLDLQKYWLVLKRRWIPATTIFASVVSISIVWTLFLDKVYEAEAKLLIKADQSAKLTGLEDVSGEIKGLTTDSDPLSTEAEIIQSRPIVNKIISELDLRDEEGELIKYRDFADVFAAKPIVGTDLLTVTYTDKDPELAASIVNKAVEIYVADHTSNNRSETSSAKDFIDEQLPQVEANVREAEANLRNFKNRNRIASLDEETTANIGSLSSIGAQIDALKAQLQNVNARYSQLNNRLGMDWQEASAVSALSQSLAVQKVLEQLQTVKVTLAQKQNYLSNNAPQIIALQEEEADLTALLDRQIANTVGEEQRGIINKINILSFGDLKQAQIAEFADLGLQKEGLEKQLAALTGTYESYQQKSDNLPQLQEQRRELDRRVEAAQSTYQTLLAKLQETQIAEQQNIGNVRVVAEAEVPDKSAGPNRKLFVAGAGVAGALLGIAVAFLLDIKDKTIKNTQEIKTIFPYSLAGVVPDLDKIIGDQQLLLSGNSTANLPQLAATNISVLPIREAYHDIQLNLKLLNSEIDNKVIAVTSSVSGEGKSSVSANLAIAQAQCGQKVLLVDGDLRRPTQHDLWEISNNLGLADILQREAQWQDALRQVMPGLDVITAGTIPQHPISLLNSPSMKNFIGNVSQHYDCVIFDTPPLIGLADSKIIGKSADGLLFVMRPGVANYDSVAAATELLADRDFNILGVVANAVDFNKETYAHGYYYADKKYLEAVG